VVLRLGLPLRPFKRGRIRGRAQAWGNLLEPHGAGREGRAAAVAVLLALEAGGHAQRRVGRADGRAQVPRANQVSG